MPAIRKTKPLHNVTRRPKRLSDADLARSRAAQQREKTLQTIANDKPAKTAKAANGPETKPAAADAAKASESDSEGSEGQEKRRRGVIPTMPEAIIYRLNGKVFASIYNPVDGSVYTESGKGEGSAKGALEDSGFRLSAVFSDGSTWLAEKLPAGAELIGYCTIKGFPLPKQS